MKLTFLCVASYNGMYALFENIAARRNDLNLIPWQGDLEDIIKIVESHHSPKINAIISYGNLALSLQKKVSIPVYRAQPSLQSLIRAVDVFQQNASLFAFVICSDTAEYCKDFLTAVYPKIPIYIISDKDDCESSLSEISKLGINSIIGDPLPVKVAEKRGFQTLLILSGMKELNAAIDLAQDIETRHFFIEQQFSLLSDFEKNSRDKVFIFDAKNSLQFSSVPTSDIPESLLELMKSRIPNVISGAFVNTTRKISEESYTLKGKPILSGTEQYAVFTLRSSILSKHYNQNAIRIYGKDTPPQCKPLDCYLGSSSRISAIQSTCNQYADLNLPIMFEGARGTGKDTFAYDTFLKSKYKNNDLVLIDGKVLDEQSWNFLLKSDDSPLLNQNICLYFARINCIDPNHRHQLILYMKDSNFISKNFCLFSISTGQEDPSKNELYLYLLETVHCLRIVLPSLSERREDIPYLSSLFINKLNLKYGTNISGFNQEAMLVLQNYEWTRNVDQLYEFIQEILLHSTSSVITYEQVCPFLNKKNPLWFIDQTSNHSLNLNKSLDEITHDIVTIVYEREQKNQTRTAKKLGISRSTLWRMLR